MTKLLAAILLICPLAWAQPSVNPYPPSTHLVPGLSPIPPNTVLGNCTGSTAVPGSCPASVSLLSNPQALYKLDEGSGSIFHDTSGNGYDCTVNAAFTWLPVQGVTSLPGSQATCPGAAFHNAGLIQIWLRPTVNSSLTFLLFSTVSQAQITYKDNSHSLTIQSQNGTPINLMADRLDGDMSAAFVLSPFASYVNGKPSLGPVESPINVTFSATGSVLIGYTGGAFTGNIYAIAVYPAGTYTQTQVAQNDAAMWTRLRNAGVFPRDADTSEALNLYVGDSLTWGANMTWIQTYPYLAETLRGFTGKTYNLGQPAQRLSQIISQFPTLYAKMLAPATGAVNVNIMASVNDVTDSVPAATIYANLNSFCSSVHTANPAAKCLVSTLSPVSTWSGAQQTIRTTLNGLIYSNWLSGALSADGVIDVANDPIVGNQNLASNTTWFSDGTHFTAAAYLFVAQRFALTQCLQTNKPCQIKATVPYQYFSSTASTTATVNLLQLGPRQKVCGVTQRVTTAFAGTSITAISATVGDSVSGVTTQYAPLLSWFATGAQDNVPVFVSSNGLVQANVTATGANLSALTAGSADISLCVVQQ